jgi:hypothetical protein
MDNIHSKRGYPANFEFLSAFTFYTRFPCIYK